MDKTHTFMIASVDGNSIERMDSLCVDLFDAQGREMGRSTFSQKLPDGKTLLTFDAVPKVPEALRMEFFGGPVGYGGNVVLILKDINFKIVDVEYTKEICSDLEKETYKMNYKVIEKNNKKYIECVSAETPLSTEQDALDLIAACVENDTYMLMIHAEALSEDFFKLKTGLAGKVLQKFVNYHVKTAAIITSELTIKGNFKEVLAEANRGNDFRVFNNAAEAENWLLI